MPNTQPKQDWEEFWEYFLKDCREYGVSPDVLVDHVKEYLATQISLAEQRLEEKISQIKK